MLARQTAAQRCSGVAAMPIAVAGVLLAGMLLRRPLGCQWCCTPHSTGPMLQAAAAAAAARHPCWLPVVLPAPHAHRHHRCCCCRAAGSSRPRLAATQHRLHSCRLLQTAQTLGSHRQGLAPCACSRHSRTASSSSQPVRPQRAQGGVSAGCWRGAGAATCSACEALVGTAPPRPRSQAPPRPPQAGGALGASRAGAAAAAGRLRCRSCGGLRFQAVQVFPMPCPHALARSRRFTVGAALSMLWKPHLTLAAEGSNVQLTALFFSASATLMCWKSHRNINRRARPAAAAMCVLDWTRLRCLAPARVPLPVYSASRLPQQPPPLSVCAWRACSTIPASHTCAAAAQTLPTSTLAHTTQIRLSHQHRA